MESIQLPIKDEFIKILYTMEYNTIVTKDEKSMLWDVARPESIMWNQIH